MLLLSPPNVILLTISKSLGSGDLLYPIQSHSSLGLFWTYLLNKFATEEEGGMYVF